ncbi:hypothetical protein K3X41_01255 [Aliiroseovarius crassostreae]|uniref:hypothetical protein n=1 Tax=Aliiroseovarius crassostreae TaxID=154981 RepID=UPI0022000007|nr:hypothetical protein [Aliiroseovarius crassostreae]UWQ11360.1 hypothetical protein K3X41_01255 [Aliiroseovarius crassostreae]
MKYEFKGKSLGEAVARSVRKAQPGLERKTSASISAGIEEFNYETIAVKVTEDNTYTLSWTADHTATDGAVYGVDIASHDGYGSHCGTFTSGDSITFTARATHTAKFRVGFSITPGNVVSRWFGSYDVTVEIS